MRKQWATEWLHIMNETSRTTTLFERG